MSRPYPSPVVIPPPIGLQEQLRQNRTAYFNYRSFQQNWTVSSIIHVPLYRPGGSSVMVSITSSGDQLVVPFQWYRFALSSPPSSSTLLPFT
jgi:hypothetical protein